jgi:hypothetical protein
MVIQMHLQQQAKNLVEDGSALSGTKLIDLQKVPLAQYRVLDESDHHWLEF